MRSIIFGAGGHGREVATFLRDDPNFRKSGRSLYFAVDVPDRQELLGVPVIAAGEIAGGDNVYIAVGDGRTRERIEAILRVRDCILPTLKAPSAIVSRYAEIAPGALFSEFALVTSVARIGRQFQCNMFSYVAHDCDIGDYVTFAPRVSCNGNVRIGDHAYIGTNATIRQGITIGARAIVGMGAVVVKDVPDDATVMGNPARER
jgi:sugar O-acyltransferase (sialic acid O-acetyltransferase NeuD family)